MISEWLCNGIWLDLEMVSDWPYNDIWLTWMSSTVQACTGLSLLLLMSISMTMGSPGTNPDLLTFICTTISPSEQQHPDISCLLYCIIGICWWIIKWHASYTITVWQNQSNNRVAWLHLIHTTASWKVLRSKWLMTVKGSSKVSAGFQGRAIWPWRV